MLFMKELKRILPLRWPHNSKCLLHAAELAEILSNLELFDQLVLDNEKQEATFALSHNLINQN